MKIAESNETFLPISNGVDSVVLAYSTVLANRGNEVYVITPMNNSGYRGRFPFEILDYTSVKLSKGAPWTLGIESIDTHFAERVKMLDLDLVHVHSPGTSAVVAMKIAKKKHIPVIGSFHTKFYDDFLRITHSKTIATWGTKYVASFYEKCDEVWAVSEDAAATLKSYGYKGDILIMPNGTNIRPLNTEIIDDVAKKYGIRKDIPVFLFVGRINRTKNLECSIKACEQLKKEGLDFQLVFVGSGMEEKKYKQMAKDCGIAKNLIMTGHIDNTEELDVIYNLATLFLLPSVFDNAPMVVREAAAVGTPCVVVEGTGSAEVVKNGKNSFTCKNDPTDLAATIKTYLAMPEKKRKKIQEEAKRTIPLAWDGPLMDKIYERYQAVIENYKRDNK